MGSADGDKKALDAVGASEWQETSDSESTLKALEQLAGTEIQVVSPILEGYLAHIARTGETMFSWELLRPLIKVKMDNVIEDFVQISPIEEVPPYPNVDAFKFDSLKTFLSNRLQTHQRGPPFTIQRICELLTEPTKNHKRIDKFLRALEKNFLVISSSDCFGKPAPPEVLANGVAEADGAGDNLSDKSSSGVSSSSEKLAEDSNSDDEEKKKEEKEEPAADMEVDVVCPSTEEATSSTSEVEGEDGPDRKKRKIEENSEPSTADAEHASSETSAEAAVESPAMETNSEPLNAGEAHISSVELSSSTEPDQTDSEVDLGRSEPDTVPQAENSEPASSSESSPMEVETPGEAEHESIVETRDTNVLSVEQEVKESVNGSTKENVASEVNGNLEKDLMDSKELAPTVNGCADGEGQMLRKSDVLPVNGTADGEHENERELLNGSAEDHEEVESPVLDEIPSKPPSAAAAPAVSET